ncbi:MAG: DUF4105 domain-containing protein [Bacteroidetes bacterium]|nr:DUF4105 domain-containing protein [Bacteroidota bacterium]
MFGTTQGKAQLPPVVSAQTRISVITIFPGEPTYSAWGHSALRVYDPVTSLDASFNYGTFDVNRPYFIPRFAYGDMLYQLSVDPTPGLLQGANFQKRSVVEQVLRLDSLQVSAIYSLLLENLRPENKSYPYDFVFDNCSTRLLDLLFAVEAIELPEIDEFGTTYRHMLDDFVHERALLDLGIDLVIGSELDQVPSIKQRTFLPTYLLAILDQSTTPTGMPLVAEKSNLLTFQSEESSVLPPWTLWLSVLAGAIIVFVTLRKPTSATTLDRLFLGLIGFMGLFLLMMWFATLHHVTSENWNIAWALPLHLVVAVGWKRFSWLNSYLKWTGIWMMGVVLLQLMLPQATPPAMIPILVAFSVRFWVVQSFKPPVIAP